jgi:hypothetical protein
MQCKPPDNRFYAELTDLNAGFLRLIGDCELTWHGALFGLDAGVVNSIRNLSAAELDFIAATPSPLAGFATLPPPDIVADSWRDSRPDDVRWLESAQLFSTQLIVYLWQITRQDPLTAALCVGPATGQASRLAEFSFREVQACARPALYQLRARLARHRRFWPDLIRAARSADGDFRALSRLTIIPLTLGKCR